MFKHFNSIQLNDSSKAWSNAPIRFIWLCHFNWLVNLLKTKVGSGCEPFLLLYADELILIMHLSQNMGDLPVTTPVQTVNNQDMHCIGQLYFLYQR